MAVAERNSKQRLGVQNRQHEHADKNEHNGRQAIKTRFDRQAGANVARGHDRLLTLFSLVFELQPCCLARLFTSPPESFEQAGGKGPGPTRLRKACYSTRLYDFVLFTSVGAETLNKCERLFYFTKHAVLYGYCDKM
jgi:hypothetical protein